MTELNVSCSGDLNGIREGPCSILTRALNQMHILGVSSLEHDPAAVLVCEEGIVAAIEEGKLLRSRSSQGVPRNAINFCLAKARVQWKDLDQVAIAGQPLQKWGHQASFRAREALKAPISGG